MQKYLDLISKHQNQFDKYYQALVSYNQHTNLTAITEYNEVYNKHFLDSVLSIDEIDTNATLIDIGAGAGFPSLPIKIVRPDIKLTMLDSLNKRINFLNEICNELNINSTNVHSRAEDYALKYREKFDIATARAVARLNTLVEYLLPLTKVSGKAIIYKGSNYLEELNEAENAITTLGGKLNKVLHFNLPNDMGERHIIIIDKISTTPTKYPRAKNEPKLNPIK